MQKLKEKILQENNKDKDVKHLDLKNYKLDLLYNHSHKKDNKIKMIRPDEIGKGQKISIVNDGMFHSLLFNESRLKYSAKLLSFLIDASYEELNKNLKLDKESIDKEKESDKSSRVDYVGKINDTYLCIEMNTCQDEKYMKRNLLNAFRLMNRKNKVGENDFNATRLQSILVNINNFAFNDIDKVVDINTIRNDQGITLNDSPIIIQIYLPNLVNKWYNLGTDGLNYFERLLLVYTLYDIDLCEEIRKGDNFMGEFLKDAINASYDDDVLQSYSKEWEIRDASLEEGYNSGYETGHDEGIEQAKREMAKDMLKENEPIEKVIKYSKLSEKEVKEIKKSLKP